MIQPFLSAEVGKDGLDNGQTPGIPGTLQPGQAICLPSGVSIRVFICSIRLGYGLSTSIDKKRREVVGWLKQWERTGQTAQSCWRAR
jgi:hypothetical protein